MKKRVGTVLLALALVMALLALPMGVAAAADEADENDDREPTTAGEQLGGVVSVQGAELDGNLSERSYSHRIENAETDSQKAKIVDERLAEIEGRIADHEERLAELEAEREAGNISEGRYRAEVATLTAERDSTERAAERAGETARGIPEDVLAERGVSTERIDELRTNASRVGGPEQREIARGITGDDRRGPTDENRTQTGDDRTGPDRPSENTTTEDDRREDRDSVDETDGSERTDESTSNDVDDENSNDQTASEDSTDRSTDDSQRSPNQ
ncbi:MAG: DUF7096 domain-containing protein [Halohasta sp.]